MYSLSRLRLPMLLENKKSKILGKSIIEHRGFFYDKNDLLLIVVLVENNSVVYSYLTKKAERRKKQTKKWEIQNLYIEIFYLHH